MSTLMTSDELIRFERKWKIICTVFAVLFVAAMFDHLMRHPDGWEAALCYGVGIPALAGCIYSAKRLRDAERLAAVDGGMETVGEDLSVPIEFDD